VSESEGAAGPDAQAGTTGFGWTKLLRWSAIAAVVVVLIVNVLAGLIPPLLVFAVVWIGGVIWLGRATTGPAILLLVAFIAFIGLSAPFVIPTMAVPASSGDFILNAASLIAALIGIVAAVATIRGRIEPSPAARSLGLAGIAVFVAATVLSIVALVTYDNATEEEGDVTVVAKDIEFQDTSLSASSGQVSVFVDNQDSTLHTFTIDELEVDLDIPAGKSARVTFSAEPGEYTFYCVPHEADMEGTIQIQ
jgi:plastocyanin